MDQWNMNNIKYHEKINTHTQITENNYTKIWPIFFSKRQYVRPCKLSSPWLPSYRNLSIDLQNKSIDWFLYEDNTGS